MRTVAPQNSGERIELSRRDRFEFVEALLSPPLPGDRLQLAMRRHSQVIREQ